MKILEEGKIGSLTLRNRVFMTPMGTATDPDGGFSKRNVNYYAERAKGGTGLIITAGTLVTDKFENRLTNLLDNVNKVDRLHQLAENVHFYGAKLCVQITPGLGRNAAGDPFNPPYSASAVNSVWFPNLICKPFSVEQIRELVTAMGFAAFLAQKAGADAVELHAYGGYLMDQFMTSLWNKRTDEYGGDFDGRMRFTLEIIEEIRRNCGKDFPIIAKITPDHLTPDGRQLDEGVRMAKLLESKGVDALHIDQGNYDVWYDVISSVYTEEAFQRKTFSAIKKEVGIPVLAHGKLGDPNVAESILQEGLADFIGLGHTSICEPHWVNKVAQGHYYDLRPCVGCNECLNALAWGMDNGCAINPLSGLEQEYPLEQVEQPKRLLVIGGGPAGMQTAITAAERGIQVALWEKSTALGGMLNAAGAPSFKKDVKKYVKYMENKLYRSNVKVSLNREGTLENILQGKFDYVVSATGSTPFAPPISGINGPMVVTAEDVLTGKVATGSKAVVIGGGLVGCEVALALRIDEKKDVVIIEMLDDILKIADHSMNNDMKLRKMIADSQMEIICSAKVISIDEKGLSYLKDGKEQRISCDSVILASGFVFNNEILKELTKAGIKCKSIGDSVKPRKIIHAVHEGFHTARLLFEAEAL